METLNRILSFLSPNLILSGIGTRPLPVFQTLSSPTGISSHEKDGGVVRGGGGNLSWVVRVESLPVFLGPSEKVTIVFEQCKMKFTVYW